MHAYTADSVGLSYGEYNLELKHYWQRYLRVAKHGWVKRFVPTGVAKMVVVGALLVACR